MENRIEIKNRKAKIAPMNILNGMNISKVGDYSKTLSGVSGGNTGSISTPGDRVDIGGSRRVSSSEGPVYPIFAGKMFRFLDDCEKTVESLGKNPNPDQVKDSGVRDFSRWIVPLSKAYKECYEEEGLAKALDPLKALSYFAGQFKDVNVIREGVKEISPAGIVPSKIRKKLDSMEQKRTKDFMDNFFDFKNNKMKKSLKFLGNPEPLKNTNPLAVAAEEKQKLGKMMNKLIDKVYKFGIFHEDPEKFHDGRKTLRNLMGMVLQTSDVFGYNQEDVDSLKAVFKSYGKSQDKHIAQQWLAENGFDREARIMMEKQQELQAVATEKGREFMDAGILENLRKAIK